MEKGTMVQRFMCEINGRKQITEIVNQTDSHWLLYSLVSSLWSHGIFHAATATLRSPPVTPGLAGVSSDSLAQRWPPAPLGFTVILTGGQ